jgi:hypothetical protein
MTKIERTITIHRPVEEVFAYLCDIEHGPSYISGQRERRQRGGHDPQHRSAR